MKLKDTQQKVVYVTQKVASGFPLMSILTIIFVIAKLTKTIDWSWWLVFIPLWGPWALTLALVLFVICVALVVILCALGFLCLQEAWKWLFTKKQKPYTRQTFRDWSK